MKKRLIYFIFIFQSFNLLGQSCAENALISRAIKANDTDNNINWELQNHYIFLNPDCIQKDMLLIHLVGSFDNPASTSYLPALAANNGYKAINLKYPNGTAALTACGTSNDANCFKGFREEIIYGVDSNSSVDVDSNNCIINRIEKLIKHLHNNYPSENWNLFLTSTGSVNWLKIVLSGHSQGGGHAAYIAKRHQVNRILMFSSPNDYSSHFSAPANWISEPSLTQNSNYFAFGNLFDDVSNFSNQFQIWNGMNLLTNTDSTNVDISECNFNYSKVLYTKKHDPSAVYSTSHNSPVIDNFTPLENGVPTFTPVWKYMLGICDFPNSISENKKFQVKLFPNPSISKVEIESSEKIHSIEIYNATGSLLKTLIPKKETTQLNIEEFKGVLYLKIQNSNTIIYKTLIAN